jgi:DNA-binding response OmpR family regulator
MPDVARILVVDDEPKIVLLVRDYLERAGFAVSTAQDGPEALMRAHQERPDLVVLDLGLPGLDGLEVTRRLRRDSGVPIIMLTARDDETDKVVGLELGADDYVTKPFSPRELTARVRAVLRRHAGEADAEVIRAGDLTLDVPRLRAEVSGRTVPASRAASSRAHSYWTPSTAWRSNRTSGRSTPTSRTSAARSSLTPARPDTCSRCMASDIG